MLLNLVASGSTERVLCWQFVLRGELSLVLSATYRTNNMQRPSSFCIGESRFSLKPLWLTCPTILLEVHTEIDLPGLCHPGVQLGFINPMPSHLQGPDTSPKYSGKRALFTLPRCSLESNRLPHSSSYPSL